MAPRLRWLRRLLMAAALCTAQAAAVDVAILDRPVNRDDHRRDYPLELLRAVMARTVPEFGPYRIELAPIFMERARLLNEMQQGKRVNISPTPVRPEWLATLRSVPVPVDLGLQSWRLLLINSKNRARLQHLAASGQFKLATAGVGNGWALQMLLRDLRYDAVAGNSYEGLFYMLAVGRFDYFLRGVNEIFPEYDYFRQKLPSLAVEESLLVHVRIPALFFISPNEERLQRRVTAGMEAMLKDGSLERLVLAHYRPDLERANLCHRARIDLLNEAFDPAMQARRELWFDPFHPRHGLCPRVPGALPAAAPAASPPRGSGMAGNG